MQIPKTNLILMEVVTKIMKRCIAVAGTASINTKIRRINDVYSGNKNISAYW